jgi:hypothetical protein
MCTSALFGRTAGMSMRAGWSHYVKTARVSLMIFSTASLRTWRWPLIGCRTLGSRPLSHQRRTVSSETPRRCAAAVTPK